MLNAEGGGSWGERLWCSKYIDVDIHMSVCVCVSHIVLSLFCFVELFFFLFVGMKIVE